MPTFQPSLLPKTKGGPVIHHQLPPRQARIVVYNMHSNETSVWTVQLSEVHATAHGGHHRGKFISSKVVEDVQPPMTYEEYLQVHGKMIEFSGCQQTPGGWMANGAEVNFPADQYANYLANWYRNQNPMMTSNAYYGAQQIMNTYPTIRHP